MSPSLGPLSSSLHAVSNVLHGTRGTGLRRIELRGNLENIVDTALKIKHHSLTGRIDLPLMYAAFRAVKRNKGQAGVDRVSSETAADF